MLGKWSKDGCASHEQLTPLRILGRSERVSLAAAGKKLSAPIVATGGNGRRCAPRRRPFACGPRGRSARRLPRAREASPSAHRDDGETTLDGRMASLRRWRAPADLTGPEPQSLPLFPTRSFGKGLGCLLSITQAIVAERRAEASAVAAGWMPLRPCEPWTKVPVRCFIRPCSEQDCEAMAPLIHVNIRRTKLWAQALRGAERVMFLSDPSLERHSYSCLSLRRDAILKAP